MEILNQYIEINRLLWNKRTETHIQSEFYDLEGFKSGKSSLNDIELNLMGDVRGKKILHLQCHFGQDTLSLARMGAKVTGVDLSDRSIEYANQLAQTIDEKATFICCDIFDLKNHLHEKFDIVFTTYGTIGWLPDLNIWATVISHFLEPNGKLIFVEFHPIVWMFDNDLFKVSYHYNNVEPIIENESGTYANNEADINLKSVGWNHSLSEVISSLLKHNLNILDFKEYYYSPYNCLSNMIEKEPKKFVNYNLEDKIPYVYSLICEKI